VPGRFAQLVTRSESHLAGAQQARHALKVRPLLRLHRQGRKPAPGAAPVAQEDGLGLLLVTGAEHLAIVIGGGRRPVLDEPVRHSF
jgi:hypothetical protein